MDQMKPGSSDRTPRKIRHILIYPRFQLMLLGVNLTILTVTLILFWVSAQNHVQQLKAAAALSGIEFEFYSRLLDFQTTQFHRAFGLSITIAFIISTGLTLVISHRIAGPLVRLRHFFRALKEDQTSIPQLKFRDGDFLSDLPPLINDAIGTVVERQEKRRAG